MDNHFRNVFDIGTSTKSFIPSTSFSGSRKGYVFQLGDKGLGYYYDEFQNEPMPEHVSFILGDCSRFSHFIIWKIVDRNDDDEVPRKKTRADAESKEKATAISLDDLNETPVELDVNSLKVMILNFEKKINKNQKMRMKYADEPEKFMESEIELDQELNNLYTVTASPELYPFLVQSGAIVSILGMITHENTDISLVAVGLLKELTDPDTILEVEEALVIVDAIIDGQVILWILFMTI